MILEVNSERVSPERAALLDRLRALFGPTLAFLRYDLYDLALLHGRGSPTLRVTIDRPEGVSLDDCQRVSQSLSVLLDQVDPLQEPYQLEVSSPGAERPLRNPDEFRRFLGRKANVRYRAGEGEQVAEGRLHAVSPDGVELQVRDARVVSIPFKEMLAARLAIDL